MPVLNLVEMVADEQSFCQPCKYGNLVDGHAVYCHNTEWEDAPRKCHRSWYTGGTVRDEDCPGFAPNPEYRKEHRMRKLSDVLPNSGSGVDIQGEVISLPEIAGQPVVLTAAKILPSKFDEDGQKDYALIQIQVDGDTRVVQNAGKALVEITRLLIDANDWPVHAAFVQRDFAPGHRFHGKKKQWKIVDPPAVDEDPVPF